MGKTLRNIAIFMFFAPLSAMFAEPFFEAVFDILKVDTEKLAVPVVTGFADFFASDQFIWWAYLAISFGIGVWSHWLATKFDLGKSGRTHAIIPDPEINVLQRDVSHLMEILTGYGEFETKRDDLAMRMTRLQNSDHLIWHDNPAKQLRRDFLNVCGRSFSQEKRGQDIRDEIRDIGHDLFDLLKS